MADQSTGPSSWEQFFSGLGSVVLDGARAKLVDIEQPTDTNNVPDKVDLSKGVASAASMDSTGGAWSLSVKPEYLAIGALAVMAAWMIAANVR
jgi:hypothetical protein